MVKTLLLWAGGRLLEPTEEDKGWREEAGGDAIITAKQQIWSVTAQYVSRRTADNFEV